MRTFILIAFMAVSVLALSCGSRDSGPLADPHPVIVVKTTLGTMEITLDGEKAPRTVKNFLSYVEEGFYDDTIFHRVIPGSMIQGGGFTRFMEEKKTHRAVRSEASNGLRNGRGTIAMARLDKPNSAASQFFINLKDNPDFDHRDNSDRGYGYTVFGRVTAGMDVAEKIGSMEVDTESKPKLPMVIFSMQVKK
jgi:cyclophilin family peptidyl-prolyl cis-trans isomerase